MFDGYRHGDSRFRRRGIGDRVAHSLLSMLSLEGIVNLIVALAIILALLSYVIIPAVSSMPDKLAALHDQPGAPPVAGQAAGP